MRAQIASLFAIHATLRLLVVESEESNELSNLIAESLDLTLFSLVGFCFAFSQTRYVKYMMLFGTLLLSIVSIPWFTYSPPPLSRLNALSDQFAFDMARCLYCGGMFLFVNRYFLKLAHTCDATPMESPRLTTRELLMMTTLVALQLALAKAKWSGWLWFALFDGATATPVTLACGWAAFGDRNLVGRCMCAFLVALEVSAVIHWVSYGSSTIGFWWNADGMFLFSAAATLLVSFFVIRYCGYRFVRVELTHLRNNVSS